MSFYDQAAATTARLLKLYGQSVTVSHYAPTYNVSTNATTKGAATLTCRPSAIVLPASSAPAAALSLLFDNTTEANSPTAKARYRYLKIEAILLTFEPAKLDEVTIGSTTWIVTGCTPVNPAGTPVVYGVGVKL